MQERVIILSNNDFTLYARAASAVESIDALFRPKLGMLLNGALLSFASGVEGKRIEMNMKNI